MKTSDEMFRNVMRRRDQHQAAQKAKRRWLGGVAALCCLCLVMAAFFVLGGQKASDPALSAPETTQSLLQQTPEAPSAAPETLFYHILIDVNPSICLTANEADLVTAAEALNADGEEILAQAQVEGLPVEDAMKEVANVLVDMGYISEEANSILVSVEGARESMEGQIKDQLPMAFGNLWTAIKWRAPSLCKPLPRIVPWRSWPMPTASPLVRRS